ncbi:MAG: PAS domain S-box protein, partial [Gemmatimonadota bacterium]|nr:PAS domain S-box protein [Gemmatimonadota bacterium]
TDELIATLDAITPNVSVALDRLANERDLERDQEALRLRDRAMQAVSQGIAIAEVTGNDTPLVYVSPGLEALTGYTPDEARGRTIRSLVGQRADAEIVAELRAALMDGRRATAEVQVTRRDGTTFWSELAVAPVHRDDGTTSHVVGVFTDITERRRLEEQYRHAQKMEAIGQLAGGVAHDFNNLLTIINGYCELIGTTDGLDDTTRQFVAEIRGAGERASALTHQLLAFSRRQVLELKNVNINAVVTDTERMLRRVIGEHVTLVADLDATIADVRVDPGQLSQVLMNLAVNARDAMANGGRLTIATKQLVLDQAWCDAHRGARPGPAVMLAVGDTGTGMDATTLERIFEPFFTTKPIGKGTGLGLATVHGIVQQSRGHLTVTSEVGHGTTFAIYFPSVGHAATGTELEAAAPAMPRGTETVLLVEDDAGVREITRLILERSGYTVLLAADAREALDVCASATETVHLLIADVVLPGVGGRPLAELVRERNPQCRVLLVSGYTDDMLLGQDVLSSQVAFLQKPYSPLALALKVRDVLDSGAAAAP